MITAGLEDYLEFIYNATKSSSCENLPKAIDIANAFNISRSSVSETLIKLVDLELIIYKGRKGIEITQKGKEEALKIIKKHEVLCAFFNKILGIDIETAGKNACRIEHVIDNCIIDKISLFTLYCIENQLVEKFKKC